MICAGAPPPCFSTQGAGTVRADRGPGCASTSFAGRRRTAGHPSAPSRRKGAKLCRAGAGSQRRGPGKRCRFAQGRASLEHLHAPTPITATIVEGHHSDQDATGAEADSARVTLGVGRTRPAGRPTGRGGDLVSRRLDGLDGDQAREARTRPSRRTTRTARASRSSSLRLPEDGTTTFPSRPASGDDRRLPVVDGHRDHVSDRHSPRSEVRRELARQEPGGIVVDGPPG